MSPLPRELRGKGPLPFHPTGRAFHESLEPVILEQQNSVVSLLNLQSQKPNQNKKAVPPSFFSAFLSASSDLFCPEPLGCVIACRVAQYLLAALLTSPYLC